jgi:CIC family chloride channel protein
MRPPSPTVQENILLADVIKTFQDYNVSYVNVVNEEGKLSGIISFRDIRQVLQEPQKCQSMAALEVATKPVFTVTSSEKADVALRKMGQTGVGQLPVVDTNDPRRVVGVINEKDIFSAYDRESIGL